MRPNWWKKWLGAEFGVNNKAIEAAMCQLKQSGLLLPKEQGAAASSTFPTAIANLHAPCASPCC
jgi:hypothetical protein